MGRASPVPDLAVETASEPVVAWRAWALTGDRDGGAAMLRPVAGRSRPWRPREVAEATCKSARFHQAPHPGCSCGLHGTHGFEILRKTRCPAAFGRVAMWGRVIEHDHGYRAQFAYPQRLALVCQFCFWLWGPLAEAPQHVGWFPRNDLIPFCDRHLSVAVRFGLRPRRVLAAPEVEQALRDAYAVDVLVV
jgi:hypothetical protein